MAKFKIVYREKNKAVCIRYTHARRNTLFTTIVRIDKDFFTGDQEQPVSKKCRGYTTHNDNIHAEKNRLEQIYFTQKQSGGSVQVDAIRDAYDKSRADQKGEVTIVTLWGEFLESIKDNVQPASIQSYKQSLAAFETFAAEGKHSAITPERFTVTHYNKFLGHLNKTFKPNTVAKHLKRFSSFLTYLTDLKISVGFDPNKISYKERPGVKISLTEEELQKIADQDFSDRLSRVRDLFVLQCSTGLRISDLKRVDRNIKGNKIILDTQKTQTAIEIPIAPKVREILERNNYKMPVLSEQKYREGIKDIYKKLWPDNTIQVREGSKYKTVKVHEEISSHDAVRTFITLSHERGMSVNSIAKITGKTVKVLLSNYLVESQKVADKEMEKAWGAAPLKVAR